MSKPVRIQLRRTKGWRMPPNTVKVTRPSKWGNPIRAAKGASAQLVVDAYRAWLTTHPDGRATALRHIEELRGKNLACWCPLDQPCHADVLLELANE